MADTKKNILNMAENQNKIDCFKYGGNQKKIVLHMAETRKKFKYGGNQKKIVINMTETRKKDSFKYG